MAVIQVQQGECFSSLAARFGLSGWQDLYDHAANAELKQKRPNPNVLAPGDQVVIPDSGPEKLVGIATTRTHLFTLQVQKVKLRVALVDRSGKPYAGKRFIVNAGSVDLKDNTTSAGMIEVQVPATASTARLRVWLGDDDGDASPTIDRNLSIGHIDLNSGVRGRLANLGYSCPMTGDGDTEMDDRLMAAARAFRAEHGLPDIARPQDDDDTVDESATAGYATQLIDDAFRSKLLAVYESSATS